jgi:hypothetical protein
MKSTKLSVHACCRAFLLILALICVFFPPLSGANAGDSREAVQWLAKGVDAYDKEDYGAAKTSLQMALQLQPNFSEAYLLKGMLEYHDGDQAKAEASWKRALELNPQLPDKMRNRLEKRAHEIESNLSAQDFSHFVLQFHGADQRDQAWQTVKYLDEAYNDLGSRFSSFPEKKFTVIIFTTDEFWEAWNAPGWLGGFFDSRDGRVRLRIDSPPGGDDEMRRRIRHEFTHAFVNRLYSKELPVWFQEGIAQFYAYAETDNSWKDRRLEQLSREMKNAPLMDMAKLERTIKTKDSHPGLVYLAYLESEGLILSVAKARGDSWIQSVMERVRNGSSFESAFNEVIGLSAAEMLDKYRHALS